MGQGVPMNQPMLSMSQQMPQQICQPMVPPVSHQIGMNPWLMPQAQSHAMMVQQQQPTQHTMGQMMPQIQQTVMAKQDVTPEAIHHVKTSLSFESENYKGKK